MSEYIYYCLNCKKFFYLTEKNTALVACQHCNLVQAICTEQTKEAYTLMSDTEKEVFKWNIRTENPSLEDYHKKKADNQRKELSKKSSRVIVTTADLKEDYEIIEPVYYQISNRGIFSDEIMRKSAEYQEMFAEMKANGQLTEGTPDWGFLYGNYSVGQDKKANKVIGQKEN